MRTNCSVEFYDDLLLSEPNGNITVVMEEFKSWIQAAHHHHWQQLGKVSQFDQSQKFDIPLW